MRAIRVGLAAAALALAIDQGSKLWLLHVYDLARRQPVRLAPVLDLILAWNRGISYSLFTSGGEAGRYALIAVTIVVIALLLAWLAKARRRVTVLAIGLLIGGALGNLVDRFLYGAVMDFVWFHLGHFSWYVFNAADCAIVAGVALLLVEWVLPEGPPRAAKMP